MLHRVLGGVKKSPEYAALIRPKPYRLALHLPSRPHVSAKLPTSSNSPSRPVNIGSTPIPRTTLASRTFKPIQSSPLRVSLDRTPRMRGTARLDPSTRRRESPPVALASGAITLVVEVTSANSFGLAGPTLTSVVSLPSVARHRPNSVASTTLLHTPGSP